MTSNDKTLIYNFMRQAAAAVCGYTPSAFCAADVSFTDDKEDTADVPHSNDGATRERTLRGEETGSAMLTTQVIADRIASCSMCRLCSGRTHTVPGMGVANPPVLVVGEGPGHEEDISGLPFVGPAGKLLDKMLLAIGLDRDKNCYIANVVKCRPPNNRTPTPEEAAACLPFLDAQIHVLSPRFILAMGRTAGQTLLGVTLSLSAMRGKWYSRAGIPLLVTYHPSALLRDQSLKRFAWEDLKMLRDRLNG